jgi:hypothetical protein
MFRLPNCCADQLWWPNIKASTNYVALACTEMASAKVGSLLSVHHWTNFQNPTMNNCSTSEVSRAVMSVLKMVQKRKLWKLGRLQMI